MAEKITVTTRIGELMKERGMTQQQLAIETGYHYKTIQDLTNGNYKRIGLDTIGRLCVALECQPGDLFMIGHEVMVEQQT